MERAPGDPEGRVALCRAARQRPRWSLGDPSVENLVWSSRAGMPAFTLGSGDGCPSGGASGGERSSL